MCRLTFAALAAVVLASAAVAADPAACTDRSAISWYTPGDFESAQNAAEKEKRLLLVKGIAFGVDDVGAKDATKGCW